MKLKCNMCGNIASGKVLIEIMKVYINLCKGCISDVDRGEITHGQLRLRHKYVMLQKTYGYTYK